LLKSWTTNYTVVGHMPTSERGYNWLRLHLVVAKIC
jgi:hypothetical protein